MNNIWIRIGILLCALVGVIYVMHAIQEQRSMSVLSAFFDSPDRSWDWCPKDAVSVTVLPARAEVLKGADVAKFCNVVLDPMETGDLSQAHFEPWLEAAGSGEAKAVVEVDRRLGIFRSQGLPFRSTILSAELKARP